MADSKSPARYKVLITDYIWPSLEVEERALEEVEAVAVVAPDGGEETLAALAEDVDGILTCFAPVTDRVLRAASRCMVVSRYGVGVDNIDVDAATELGMVVAYVPDYCVDEVSDHTLALLLALNRKLVHFDRYAREESWGKVPLTLPVARLRGRVLGIIGLGRIGHEVCRKARAFGMEVLAHDPYISDKVFAAIGARPVSLDTLLRESDFVTLHTPLTAETIGLIGEPQLRLMKPTALLINCARGPVVDEQALVTALREGWIAGAGLDVLQSPLPTPDNPLLQMENVLVTPHVAFFSRESLHELRSRAVGGVVNVLRGEVPDNVANPSVLSHSRAKLGSSRRRS